MGSDGSLLPLRPHAHVLRDTPLSATATVLRPEQQDCFLHRHLDLERHRISVIEFHLKTVNRKESRRLLPEVG